MREMTSKLIAMMDEGLISAEAVAEMALAYMSEDDVARVAIVINQAVAYIPKIAIAVIEYSVDDLAVAYNIPCFHTVLLVSVSVL